MLAKVTGLHTSDGGVPKLPAEMLSITLNGCLGDRQNDLKHHGGRKKAVCILQQEVIDQLNLEGHPISAGTTGENILIQGIGIGDILPGTIVKFPDVELIITQDAPPCKTIRKSFYNDNFNALSHKKYPNRTRWYAEVTVEGHIKLNDPVEIIN